MNGKALAAISLTSLLVVLAAAWVGAQGGDDVSHNTSWTFQNLGLTDARVDIGIYHTNGMLAASQSVTVSASASFWAPTYEPLDPVETLNGALVAASKQPLASIANQVAVNDDTRKVGNATYRGLDLSQAAPTVYVPIVMKDFGQKYWTVLNIQSTARSGETAIRIHYYNEDGTEVEGSPISTTVPAGAAIRVAQADEGILDDGFIGSVIVEAVDSTTALAVVVNEFTGHTDKMYDEFYSYEGFISGSTRVVLPALFVNGYGSYQASTSVQNLSGPETPAEVTWHFYETSPGNPNTGEEVLSFTETITTSTSVYYPDAPYVQALKDAYEPGDDTWVGALILESSEPVVAIANELNLPYHAASYVGLTEGATELFFPLAFVKAYAYANTSFSIADMSGDVSTPVTVTVAYIADTQQCPGCSNTEDIYSFYNIDSRYQPDHLNEGMREAALSPDGVFVGSIRITANKPINGIMNEMMGGYDMDNFTSFNAFVAP